MIDSIFKKHFEKKSEDWQNRKIRVWQIISQHIISGDVAAESKFQFGHGWAFLPLAVSLSMVLVGVAVAQTVSQTVPGDQLYSLKRTVQRAMEETRLRVASDDVAKKKITVAIIVNRSQEVAHLETKAVADGEVTADEKAQIDKVKTEVGRAAIGLSVKKDETNQAAPEKAEKVYFPDTIFEAAEAEVVGEAVTQFLRSAALDPKTDKTLADKLAEVVKTAQDEYKATSSVQSSEDKEVSDKPSSLPTEDLTEESNSPETDKEGSKIDGNVESGEIEIK